MRRTLQVGPVWLAALMTLIAGVPHFSCRCPDGELKLFCLGSPSRATGCCCGGSCCAGSSGGGCRTHAALPSRTLGRRSGCCGQSHDQPVTQASANGCQVKCAGCQKTPAATDAILITPAKRTVADDRLAGLVVPTPEDLLVPLVPASGTCRITWQNHRIPPPTDLVIALQHFLI